MAVVLAALRDVAHDAEQETDEDGTTDKTNVTTKSGSAARQRRRQQAAVTCCSWGEKEAAPFRHCSYTKLKVGDSMSG